MYLTLDQVKLLWEDYCDMDIYYDYSHRNFVDLILYSSSLYLYKKYNRTYDVQNMVYTRKVFKQIEHDYESFVHRQFQLHPEFEVITDTEFATGFTIAVMLESDESEISNRFKDYIQSLSQEEAYHDKAYYQALGTVMHNARRYALEHLEGIKNERSMETDRLASGSSD